MNYIFLFRDFSSLSGTQKTGFKANEGRNESAKELP